MNEKVLIQPVRFLGPVECSECGTDVYIKHIEMIATEVGQDGAPLRVNSLVSTMGVCPKCKKEYELEQDGFYYRIKNRAPERYKHRGEVNETIRLYDKNNKENPFVKDDK